jgi:hypothetical protein
MLFFRYNCNRLAFGHAYLPFNTKLSQGRSLPSFVVLVPGKIPLPTVTKVLCILIMLLLAPDSLISTIKSKPSNFLTTLVIAQERRCLLGMQKALLSREMVDVSDLPASVRWDCMVHGTSISRVDDTQ